MWEWTINQRCDLRHLVMLPLLHANLSRPTMNSTKSSRSLTGQDASTTKCLFSKRAIWTAFWILSSPT